MLNTSIRVISQIIGSRLLQRHHNYSFNMIEAVNLGDVITASKHCKLICEADLILIQLLEMILQPTTKMMVIRMMMMMDLDDRVLSEIDSRQNFDDKSSTSLMGISVRLLCALDMRQALRSRE